MRPPQLFDGALRYFVPPADGAEGSGVATNFGPSMTSETPTDSVVSSRMAAKDAHFAGFSYNSTSAGP